jgi:hypothetical protein
VGKSNNKESSTSSTPKVVAVNSATGESYVDRAEARRLGKDEVNEFKDVESLRIDFQRRIAEAQDEEEKKKVRVDGAVGIVKL